MNQMELTVTIAVGLFAAILLGWCLRWIYGLLNPPEAPQPKADSEWAEYALACEAQRDEAQSKLSEIERDLTTKLNQANAELQAAMDGLGAARRDAQAVRAELDALKAG